MAAKVPFRERYRTSRAILGASLRLLARERDLWVFPLLALAGVAVFLGVPALLLWLWMPAWLGSLGANPLWGGSLVGLAALVASYPFALLVSLANAALCFAAHERMAGRTGSPRAAWRRALQQLGPIARFNLVALLVAGIFQVVGLLLEKLRLVPYLGTVVQSVGMLGWAAASFFAIPILVVERERSAIGAIRGSAAIARSQWGKAVAGVVTIGLALVVPMLVLFLLAFGLMFGGTFLSMASGSFPMWPMLAAMAILAAGMVLMGVLFGAVQTVYQAALYRYARTGKISRPYDRATLVDAWEPYRAT